MGLIQTVADWLRPKASYGPADEFWYRTTAQGNEVFKVTPEGALKITAVYACVRILADTVASLPLDLFQRVEGGKELANAHHLYELLKYQPNETQDSFQFLERLMVDCNTRGAFYAEKVFKRGKIVALLPLLPDFMKVVRLPYQNYLRYEYCDNISGETRIFRGDELYKIQLFTGPDGYTPISPIKYNADAVGITESTEKYAGAFFRNSAKPSGFLTTPHTLKDDATRKSMENSWNRMYQGVNNAHKVAMLDQGLEFKTISLSNEDSQLLESRRFQLSDIARIYRVPVHMIQDLSRATFNNIEHQSLDFAIHTIRPWCRRIQHAIRRDLLFEEEKSQYFAEFNLNDLMSADGKSRALFYGSAVQNGYMTRNEVRERENLNPIEGLDAPLLPLNMATQEEKEREMVLREQEAQQRQSEEDNFEEPDEEEDTEARLIQQLQVIADCFPKSIDINPPRIDVNPQIHVAMPSEIVVNSTTPKRDFSLVKDEIGNTIGIREVQ